MLGLDFCPQLAHSFRQLPLLHQISYIFLLQNYKRDWFSILETLLTSLLVNIGQQIQGSICTYNKVPQFIKFYQKVPFQTFIVLHGVAAFDSRFMFCTFIASNFLNSFPRMIVRVLLCWSHISIYLISLNFCSVASLFGW